MENNANPNVEPYFIPQNELITIEVNGFFMSVLRSRLMKCIDEYGQEKFVEFTKKTMMESYLPEGEMETEIYMYSAFLGLCEIAAAEQNKTRALTEEEKKKWDSSKDEYEKIKNQINGN